MVAESVRKTVFFAVIIMVSLIINAPKINEEVWGFTTLLSLCAIGIVYLTEERILGN